MNTKNFLGVVLVTALISGGVSGAVVTMLVNPSIESQRAESRVTISNSVIEEESAMIQAIEEVSPAVVSIVVSRDLQEFYSNPFFFFGGPMGQAPGAVVPNGEPQRRQIGGGTGFLVTADGLLLTNRHVVNDERAEFTVVMNDGETYYAKVVSKDPTNDLAVLQLFTDENFSNKPSGLPTLNLGNSDNLNIGSKVIAIGNALSEFSNTTTSGIISGKGRNIIAGGGRQSATSLNNLLQTDAAINPGNSGGPLINLAGEVIGINTAIAQQANGIGFAIPINDVKPAIESIQEFGRIVRPFLGVRFTELNPNIAAELGLQAEFGAYLMDDVQNRIPAVLPDSPASRAGLRSGDIIIGVESEEITENQNLLRLISKYKVGDNVRLQVLRGTERVTLTVRLEEFEE